MVKQDNQFSIDNSKEFLARTLLSFVDVSDETLQKITDVFEPVQYEKNFTILKEGEIAQYLYFISDGIVKISYSVDDKEIIDWFAEEGVFVGNMQSYQQKTPAVETIESIEKIDLLRARYSDIIQLLNNSHETERAVRKIMESYHSRYVRRTQSLKSLSAEKKYHLFMSEYAAYANRIPLKFIANYLGMTPETLSRMRSKYDKY